MARAKRHYVPGLTWHITHRCHKKEFLLKFHRDKKRWLYWLREAKKRHKINILGYTITSNHIHMLVMDSRRRDCIPRTLHLAASRTAWEYNRRKKRKGAFWEDRYHATAVETDKHFVQCMIYIDLNMVRARVVDHPSEWPFCGFHEIQSARERYNLINYEILLELLNAKSKEELKQSYAYLVDKTLKTGSLEREEKWTERVAVGNQPFVEQMKEKLGVKLRSRKILKRYGSYELRDALIPYNLNSYPKISDLRQ